LRGADELALGTVEVSIEASQHLASLAYTFGRAFWGAGYAFEACSATIAYVSSSTNVTCLTAEIDTRNARSIALVERLGFVRTKTIPGADFFKGARATSSRTKLGYGRMNREQRGTARAFK
jgi:RimJ/RimL family protein N-acetyltransferase